MHPARRFLDARRSGDTGKSEGSIAMLALKYLLMILGAGLFGSAGALVAYDIFLSAQLRKLLHRRNTMDETAAKRICTA